MAGYLRPGHRVACYRMAFTLSAFAAAPFAAQPDAAPPSLTLAQLNQREPPDYVAVYHGRKVLVQGVVNAPAIHFPSYTALAIQDDGGGESWGFSQPAEHQLQISSQ